MNTYKVQIDKVYRQNDQIVVEAALYLNKERIVSQSYGYPLSASKEDIERDLERWAKNYAKEEELAIENEKKDRIETQAEKTIQKLREVHNVKEKN